MKVKIYQVNPVREGGSYRMFLASDTLAKLELPFREDVYEKVYEGESHDASLEDLFRKFNLNQPEGYRARSMSVSDVVEVRGARTIDDGFYFCDMVGFKKIDFDATKVGTAPIVAKTVTPEKSMTMAEVEQMLSDMDDMREAAIENDPFDASQKSISYWYQKWLDRKD